MLANYAEARHEAVKTIDISKPPTARAPLRIYICAYIYTKLRFAPIETPTAREYKRVLASETPIIPHRVDTILGAPYPRREISTKEEKKTIFFPSNLSKYYNIDLVQRENDFFFFFLLLVRSRHRSKHDFKPSRDLDGSRYCNNYSRYDCAETISRVEWSGNKIPTDRAGPTMLVYNPGEILTVARFDTDDPAPAG